jgi:formyl-CoA transferase
MSETHQDRDAFYREARADLTGPMAGVRVLELTTTIAGPRVGGVFADYGADVVRIENSKTPDICRLLPPMMPDTDPPDGHLNAFVNKNKRSIQLDMHKPEGLETFMTLIKDFDVFVENFKKGTVDAWGCGYEAVRKVKPDIVYVSVTGYGQFGPYAEHPGYDPAAQAYSGFMWMNAHTKEDLPLRTATYLADELAGLHGALGAMAALRHRDQSGEGQRVDISLLDAMIDSCTSLHNQAAAGLPTPRPGNPIPFASPSGLYSCKDGFVYAGVLLDAHWKIMAEMIGNPELADDPEYATFPKRIANRPKVDALLAAWCKERSRAEAEEVCAKAGIAVAKVLTPQEAVENEHVQARETMTPLQHPCGADVKINNPAPKFSRTPAKNRSYAPLLGANTDEVLEQAGISAKARQELRDKGIV